MADLDREVDANELAQWLGITPTAVRDAARRGVLERSKSGFALRANVQRYCAHLRRLVIERSTGPVATERARLARAQAEAVELKNAHRRGALLDAEAVKSTWNTILVATRARLLSVPARLAQTSPSLSVQDLELVMAEIRLALTALADEVEHETEDPHPQRDESPAGPQL